jgi:hypothetical protein
LVPVPNAVQTLGAFIPLYGRDTVSQPILPKNGKCQGDTAKRKLDQESTWILSHSATN